MLVFDVASGSLYDSGVQGGGELLCVVDVRAGRRDTTHALAILSTRLIGEEILAGIPQRNANRKRDLARIVRVDQTGAKPAELAPASRVPSNARSS